MMSMQSLWASRQCMTTGFFRFKASFSCLRNTSFWTQKSSGFLWRWCINSHAYQLWLTNYLGSHLYGGVISMPSYESAVSGLNPSLCSLWPAYLTVLPPYLESSINGYLGNLEKVNYGSFCHNGFWLSSSSRANTMEKSTRAMCSLA